MARSVFGSGGGSPRERRATAREGGRAALAAAALIAVMADSAAAQDPDPPPAVEPGDTIVPHPEDQQPYGPQRPPNFVDVRAGALMITPFDRDEPLPIAGYDELNLSEAATAVKDLTDPADLRAIIAYEEAHRNRQRVVSAAQTRVAAIAQEIVGID